MTVKNNSGLNSVFQNFNFSFLNNLIQTTKLKSLSMKKLFTSFLLTASLCLLFICGSFSQNTSKVYLEDQKIISINEDNNHDLWIGTSDGLYKMNNGAFTMVPTPAGMEYITAIFPDKKNNIWIGAYNNGVAKYDGKNWTPYSKKEGVFKNYFFSSEFFADTKGNIWFGSQFSTLMFDGQKWTNFDIGGTGFVLDKKKLGIHTGFLEDDHGNVYIAGKYLGCYDGKNLKVYNKKNGLAKNVIHSMVKDKDNNIWLGHYAGLVSKFNGTYFEKIKLGGNYYNYGVFIASCYIGMLPGFILGFVLPNPNEGCYILNDSKNHIWAACYGAGGSVFKFQDNEWIKYKKSDGLSKRKYIRKILEDKTGKIWVIAKKRDISSFNGIEWTNYKKEFNGIVTNLYVDSQNNVWFATTKGLVKIENK